MKLKKVLAVCMASVFALSLVACGDKTANSGNNETGTQTTPAESTTAATDEADANTGDSDTLNYADIVLGESYTDITATIKWFSNRTDLLDNAEPAAAHPYSEYIKAFNEMYPNITVEVDATTDYEQDALLALSSGNWGDIMMIPSIDMAEISSYFIPYGSLEDMEQQVRYASRWLSGGQVYGVAATGTAQGIVYNKKVFTDAGITSIPKTPEEFINALQAIKDNTDAIPLYTNYAAGWTMSQWDDHISGTATGDDTYKNQKLVHTANPFQNYGDGAHAYNVFKIMYDAVANGLTEDNYMNTDWESSKGMLHRGEIGCMVVGSWAYSQMQAAGDTPENVGYMAFPITVNGKQYATSGADYCFGINKNSSADNQAAAMVFVKWMTEKSGFAFNEGGIPVAADDNNFPEMYQAFEGVEFVTDLPALSGEEDLLSNVNVESELNVCNGGDTKSQKLIEHAAAGDKTFDEIMDEWNQAWTDAQEEYSVEILY